MLTKIHAELVPGQVAYAVFWQRYFFRTARAMTSSLNLAGADDSEEEDLGWDEDEDSKFVDHFQASLDVLQNRVEQLDERPLDTRKVTRVCLRVRNPS